MTDPQQGPFLSIIIPAYNEERRLPPTLAKISAFLRTQPYASEILVVENGSQDNTSAVVEQFMADQVTAADPFACGCSTAARAKGRQ